MIRDKIISHLRKARYTIKCWQLNNANFSVLSNNCAGPLYLHDIHQPFLSPTVNCYILPKDYLKMLSNLEYYMSLDIRMAPNESGKGWQRGYVDDIPVTFLHIKYPDEPREKWNIRRKRVNYDNLYIMMTERDGCTYEDLLEFDKLPFKNKVVYTIREYPEIKSAFYLKGCVDSKTGQLGYAYEYPHWWSLSRYMEQFDLIRWFNGK